MSPTSPARESGKPDAIRLVLFGLPDAGKSSLLGALGQVSRTQEELLAGKLADPAHGLEAMCHRLYEEKPTAAQAPVAPFPIEFRPRAGEPVDAVILDCDGRAVNEVIAAHQAPGDDSPEGTLAHEIARADALILAVDVSAPAARTEREFAEFARFLRLLEQSRGGQTEIGGLPVFLVLTKCDLLARPTDSTLDWTERIEEQKAEVAARLRATMRRGQAAPIFGRLDLHVWATAVKRPQLKGSPARPREPYLVAELFRQCLARAAQYREHAGTSAQRLAWTAGGVGGLVLAMLAAMIGVFFTAPSGPPTPLEIEAEALFWADRPTAGERLRGDPAELRDRLAQLMEIRQDPGFDKLPSRLQNFVARRADELTKYLAYADRLRQARRPADAVREETLKEIKDRLLTTLALPHPDWADTEAGQVRQERLAECDALLASVAKLLGHYQEMIEKAHELWTMSGHQGTGGVPGINWRLWADDAEKLLDMSRDTPLNPAEPLPRAPTLTYDHVLRFDRVVEIRTEWEASRQKLARVRDLCAAVGLVTGVPGKPAVLLIPRSGFTLEAAQQRLGELQTAYPTYRVDFVRAGLPDALLPELGRMAQTSYDFALEPARAAVLQKLKQAETRSEENGARWAAVKTWLVEPKELSAWRVLALILARLHEADAADPVTALAGFLQKPSFTLDLRKLTLDVPDSVKIKPAFEATLSVLHPRTSPGKPALVFKLDGDGERRSQERLWRYTFDRQDGGPLTYQPGDELYATLPLRQEEQLSWFNCRSLSYQFERLSRPPRLHKAGEDAASGTLLEKVRLSVTPPDGLPAVPDLMPFVEMK